MRLTEEQRRRLADWESVDGLDVSTIDSQVLFMDSHGCNVVLVIVDHGGEKKGFTYRQSSEEAFFDDDPDELVDVIPETVSRTEWRRADGEDWDDCV